MDRSGVEKRGKYTRAEGMEGSIVNWIGVSGPDGDGVGRKEVEPR